MRRRGGRSWSSRSPGSPSPGLPFDVPVRRVIRAAGGVRSQVHRGLLGRQVDLLLGGGPDELGFVGLVLVDDPACGIRVAVSPGPIGLLSTDALVDRLAVELTGSRGCVLERTLRSIWEIDVLRIEIVAGRLLSFVHRVLRLRSIAAPRPPARCGGLGVANLAPVRPCLDPAPSPGGTSNDDPSAASATAS